jgi:hypothetical protein
MRVYWNISCLVLAWCIVVQSTIASEIKIQIAPNTQGVNYPKEGGAISFQREGIILTDDVHFKDGEQIFSRLGAAGGFASPIDAVVAVNWLFKEGRSAEVKKLLGPFMANPDVQLIFKEETLEERRKFLSTIEDVAGVVALEDKTGAGMWVFYKVKTPIIKVLYIDYLVKIGPLYMPGYSDLSIDSDIHNLLRALMFDTIKGGNSVSIRAD